MAMLRQRKLSRKERAEQEKERREFLKENPVHVPKKMFRWGFYLTGTKQVELTESGMPAKEGCGCGEFTDAPVRLDLTDMVFGHSKLAENMAQKILSEYEGKFPEVKDLKCQVVAFEEVSFAVAEQFHQLYQRASTMEFALEMLTQDVANGRVGGSVTPESIKLAYTQRAFKELYNPDAEPTAEPVLVAADGVTPISSEGSNLVTA